MPYNRLSGVTLILLLLGTLGIQLADWHSLQWPVAICLLFFYGLEWQRLRRAGKVFITLAFIAAIIALLSEQPLIIIQEGLNKGTFFATLLVALGFLRTAADTSPAVKRSGEQLLAQPPGRRYLAFAVGGNLFGTIINVGVLNLLGTMIIRSNTVEAAEGDQALQQQRQRSAMLGLLRGFSMSLAWSPLSLTFAMIVSSMPGLTWQQLLPLGLVVAYSLIALGWLFNRFSLRIADSHTQVAAVIAPWTVHIPIIALVALIFVTAISLEQLLQISIIVAVLLSVPVLAIIWLGWQNRRSGALRMCDLVIRQLGRFMTNILPGYRMEIVIVSTASFIGTIASAFLPPERVADWVTLLPASGLPVAAVWIVLGGGLIGLNPIVTVSILSSALPAPEVFGVPALVMGLAYVIAWGLTVSSSPVAMSTLIIGNFCHTSGATIGLRWNGLFTLTVAVLMSLLLVLLTYYL